jgi:hypothetical protein
MITQTVCLGSIPIFNSSKFRMCIEISIQIQCFSGRNIWKWGLHSEWIRIEIELILDQPLLLWQASWNQKWHCVIDGNKKTLRRQLECTGHYWTYTCLTLANNKAIITGSGYFAQTRHTHILYNLQNVLPDFPRRLIPHRLGDHDSYPIMLLSRPTVSRVSSAIEIKR